MGLGIFEESAQKNLGECKRFGKKRTGSDQDNKSKGSRVEDKVWRMPEMDGSKEAIIVLKNLMKLPGMTNIQVDMYCQVIFNCYK